MRISLLVGALVLLAAPAVALRPATIKDSAMACSDAAVLRTMIEQMKTKDDQGFQDAMVAAASSEKCSILAPGTAVDVDDASTDDGLVKLRTKDAKTDLWVLERALR
jgi:hypothetical protein